MKNKDSGPFSVSSRHVAAAILFSVTLHVGLIFSCTNMRFSSKSPIASAAKKLPSPCMYEPIPAVKQRALTETLNRFFPFIATPGHKKKEGEFGSPAKESSFELLASSESKGTSFGEDKLTLVNFDNKGPELPALTSLAGKEEGCAAASFPFDGALNLDSADVARSIETPMRDHLQASSDLKSKGPDITSSTLMLSQQPSSEPFELETNHILFERESISLRSPKLFAQGGQEGLSLPPPTPSKQEIADPLSLLPALQIEAKELVTAEKTGEFGEIISDHFSCKSSSFKIDDKEPLYVFRIELEPTSLQYFSPLETELLFLIDRSHSIDPTVFKHFKSAVSHALGLLPKSCHFNVAFFDKQTTFFEKESPLASRGDIIRAKTFLIGQDHGGLFASTDLFKALTSLRATSKGVTSAVILTDGDTFLSSAEEKEELLQFLRNRSGDLALFATATGESNNIKLLSEVTAFCRGKLTYEKSPADLQARFASLVRALSFPIAKDIELATQKDEKRKVFFLTPTHRLPVLYGRSPYVIYGTTNRTGPLTLFIQGKGARGPLTIKKQIVIEETRKPSNQILEAIEGIHQINSLECALQKR